MRRLLRIFTLRRLLMVVILVVSVGFVSGLWVRVNAIGHVYSEQDVPSAPVALVLGAKVEPSGEPSGFLLARLEIAQRLLAAGRVRVVLVSGDHGAYVYDESGTMRRWLIDRGAPAQQVVADHAGFDTYDSCQRAKRIFGVDHAIVITQSYHIKRAVSVCRAAGIETDGVGDDTARVFTPYWRHAFIREQGADVKALWDVLSHRDPVFLGRHETDVEDALKG
ncbi:vancomycin permeability regulator SanA [Allocatelliglobosispora scoriae]|uniref:Vancomycin permeability regulator SanA n=1 Tax=Allocatelliglobosispora scoriae TaxID=643052 RepID=A0A841C2A7_9ACTN|nr:ElyC/SanA/YdcF family protein [Allocatelliglobosispora scoriae]MBB5874055.1 vancomycin permeability regulator SanA [Allocatelliglobosispora scoriae]